MADTQFISNTAVAGGGADVIGNATLNGGVFQYNQSTAVSFFPLTAPVTLTMRAAFTQIPPWQLALNILIMVVFAAGSLWLAARTFRLGMLRYGKRLTWREVFTRGG